MTNVINIYCKYKSIFSKFSFQIGKMSFVVGLLLSLFFPLRFAILHRWLGELIVCNGTETDAKAGKSDFFLFLSHVLASFNANRYANRCAAAATEMALNYRH